MVAHISWGPFSTWPDDPPRRPQHTSKQSRPPLLLLFLASLSYFQLCVVVFFCCCTFCVLSFFSLSSTPVALPVKLQCIRGSPNSNLVENRRFIRQRGFRAGLFSVAFRFLRAPGVCVCGGQLCDCCQAEEGTGVLLLSPIARCSLRNR